MIVLPHQYSEHHGKYFQCFGDIDKFHKSKVWGDPSSLDFLSIYSRNGYLVKACASGNRAKDLLKIAEAIRLNYNQNYDAWEDESFTMQELEGFIRDSKRSGAFRDRLFAVRKDPIESDVLWIARDESYELQQFQKEQESRGD